MSFPPVAVETSAPAVEKPAAPVHRVWISASVGLLSFAAAATLAATAGAMGGGRLSTVVSLAAVVLGLAVGAWAARETARAEWSASPYPERLGVAYRVAAIVIFAAVVLRQFLWLAISEDGVVTQPNPYNYGDLPLHWTYVAYFARDAPFWPPNPVFASQRLSYPIGADLLAAVAFKLGAPVGLVLRVTGLVASLALAVALRRWGGSIALLAVTVSGGLALERFEPGAFLRAADFDLPWKNVLLTLFVPQRGFLFALPAGLLLLASARDRLLRGRPGLPPAVEGLLWGVMPLFHVHTFLVVSLVFGAWSLIGRRVREALPTLAVAFPLGTATAWAITDGFTAARMIWWKPGWMIGDQNPVVFLLLNFGLLLPLAAAVLAFPPRSAPGENRIVAGTAIVLLLALFFVMLAPWQWDNTKAIVWAVLLLWGPLVAWLQERSAALRAVLVVLLVLPGVPALVASLRPATGLVVFQEEEVGAVCAALAEVPPGARVATAQTFNHPVALCGRAIVAGYGGHLWTHGIAAGPVEERLKALMMGWPGWETEARELGATHLYWGHREELDFAGSARAWAHDRKPLARGSWGSLYALTD